MTGGGSGRNRRSTAVRRLAGVAAALLALVVSSSAPPAAALASAAARTDGGTADREPKDHSLQDRAVAIATKGLEWMKAQQNDDGSFNVARNDHDVTQAPVAVTALSALAFMASGSTMGRGPYREQVSRAITYLLESCSRDYRFTMRRPRPDGTEDLSEVTYKYLSIVSDGTSRMHGHGYATLALAEAYGTYKLDSSYGSEAVSKARTQLAEIRSALVDAVRLIEASQNVGNSGDRVWGGWMYEPGAPDHEGSVTITMIQALRAARDVGVMVDKSVIDRAVAYIHESQSRTGGFVYSLANRDRVTYALTAAAVATLNATGDYDSEVIDRGIEYLEDHDPLLHVDRRLTMRDEHPYYARLYAAQAYYVYRDPRFWERWQPLIIDEYAAQQDSSGAIGQSDFGSFDYGRVYSTAAACLVLLMPQQYLPMFQK